MKLDDFKNEMNKSFGERHENIPELKPNEMEFIDEIATQLTEERYGEEMYESKDSTDTSFGLREEAQDFYNESYDEVEKLYINLIIKNK